MEENKGELREAQSFQSRVFEWMRRCFVRPDGLARDQRAFRFIEEAIELVQAAGTSREDVNRLVGYVYSRPAGLVNQEIGGTMVTLAGLASSWDLDLNEAAELELKRCEAKTEKIRAKDLAKPQRSPLPGGAPRQSEADSPLRANLEYLLEVVDYPESANFALARSHVLEELKVPPVESSRLRQKIKEDIDDACDLLSPTEVSSWLHDQLIEARIALVNTVPDHSRHHRALDVHKRQRSRGGQFC